MRIAAERLNYLRQGNVIGGQMRKWMDCHDVLWYGAQAKLEFENLRHTLLNKGFVAGWGAFVAGWGACLRAVEGTCRTRRGGRRG